MRQKELRIALVCYGGISLAVYMHGVTKEVWHVARASCDFHRDPGEKAQELSATARVYRRFLETIEDRSGIRLRVLNDIIAGSSAGGINGLFLAEALHNGGSLEPLTEMWLAEADTDRLLDPDAQLWTRYAKSLASPLILALLNRPGNAINESVAPETRNEVRNKLSRLIRSRWFEPPFSGIHFSRLIDNALVAMKDKACGPRLLPPNHPLDAIVTATDFKGHLETLRLHSPSQVAESEHRLTMGFRAFGGEQLAARPELVLAARATASFPGAFPAFQLAELDKLVAEREIDWPRRDRYLRKLLPAHARAGNLDRVALIDGSVLNNAPFEQVISLLSERPAQREVDRRIVYIDPRPDRVGRALREDDRPPGFFPVIFGSLSTIPREQPVRDSLDQLAAHSREVERLRDTVEALRPDVTATVEKLFGRTLFLDSPTVARLTAWRGKAQTAAAKQAGYAFHGYGEAKFNGIVTTLAATIREGAPELGLETGEIDARLHRYLRDERGLQISGAKGAASAEAIEFFRTHDLPFRIRRLRLLARRLTRDWEGEESIPENEREIARSAVYDALSMYLDREPASSLGEGFAEIAEAFEADPGVVLEAIGERRGLKETDLAVDQLLANTMSQLSSALKRRMLLSYLGFPFFDTVTLPLLRGEGLTEFDPVKVDRISPDDALSIRDGGTSETLRGTEFYNFGAFFSRTYRENDYLWGRLHGAERMIDIINSTLDERLDTETIRDFKRALFNAVLDEEQPRLKADRDLVDRIRAEVEARMG
ncbi:patatin-like protein [Pseudoblastomonas halimionae]|uniref:Patatin-like protein n=1 Tax=Alteriqipengyuania halimionae TaxID=1926630 RepID=A0A6I4U5E1_9SPHN|nr:patatin-like protein [Alteriqipengyuania halimionae]MXP09467.1 patatin-like protein [Alteriqipengyuania halimionae]